MWDLRRGTSSKSKLTPIYTIMPHDVSQRESAVVDAVWSNARENVVAVATSHQKSILFYNATKDVPEAVTRAPFHSLPVPESVKSLSWQRAAAGNEGGDSALSRLLIATNSGVADYQVRKEAFSLFFRVAVSTNLHFCLYYLLFSVSVCLR